MTWDDMRHEQEWRYDQEHHGGERTYVGIVIRQQGERARRLRDEQIAAIAALLAWAAQAGQSDSQTGEHRA